MGIILTMTITEITAELKKAKSVLIFSHNRPDGDTVGSATALRLALIKLGKSADLVCAHDIPEKLKYIKTARFYQKNILSLDYDAFVSVDMANEFMFTELYSSFKKHKNTFNIDHHISNSRYAKFNFVEEAGATCEIIYKIILELGVEIDSEIADSLMTGIVTDTGAFHHSNATSQTLEIASNLLSGGANLHFIMKRNFKDQPKERANLYGKVISKMRYYLEDKVGVLTITRKDIEDAGALDNMTEGFIDYPMTVESVEVAISLLETGKNRYKISLRSKGKVDVNEIASLYGGGGHVQASGALINGYMEDIIDKLVFNVKQRL
ncbi:MAG: bifunctional oligoribonuclease/PAP phosphatase NrnA [Clostridiales bacterium]|nr:bifunctional oligoribonuclease/PAP phosphatase NrnA [Clostridiales bacterium]